MIFISCKWYFVEYLSLVTVWIFLRIMFLVTPFITTNTGNYESLYAKYRTENILMLSKNTQISELKTHRNFKDVLHDMR